jgi:ring-1,2-phenylacetyl-CoA epoxidase subunit PaaC
VTTTSIRLRESPALAFLLGRADDALILGHRLSEWTGHAPMLEEELALANLGLDLIGQARSLYQLAATVEGAGHNEDDYAYLRDERDVRNVLMVELPRGDFAFTMARQFLYATAVDPWWRGLKDWPVTTPLAGLSDIAAKAERETAYHVRHSAEWLIRLGDGTAESHARAQDAIDLLWPYTGELFEPVDPDIAPTPDRGAWLTQVDAILARATLTRPADGWMHKGGRSGRHTEHLGHLLAEMQHIARAHPGATW